MIYVGISLGRGEPIAYVIAHALKVLSGAAGDRLALQRGAANAVSEARPGVIPGKLPLPRLAHLEDWNWTRAKGYCDTSALARHCWPFRRGRASCGSL
jgi:hypothetical protein